MEKQVYKIWTLNFTLKVLFVLVIFGFVAFYAIANAQLAVDKIIDFTEPANSLIKKTPADYKYSATSTEAIILNEPDLAKLKAEYNNNKEIAYKLDEIVILLKMIEKNTR